MAIKLLDLKVGYLYRGKYLATRGIHPVYVCVKSNGGMKLLNLTTGMIFNTDSILLSDVKQIISTTDMFKDINDLCITFGKDKDYAV